MKQLFNILSSTSVFLSTSWSQITWPSDLMGVGCPLHIRQLCVHWDRKHLGGFESTQEARVALGYALQNFPSASYLDERTLTYEPIVKCSSASDGKGWNSPVVPRSERNSAGWTAQLRNLWLRGAAKKKPDKEENHEILEYDSPAVMKNRMNHFRTTRLHMMMVPLSLERETRFLRGRLFPLRKKYSLQRHNCVQLIFFLYFPFYGSNGIAVTFLCFMHLLILLFVSLVTCLYYYVLPRPKFNGRKSLAWLAYVICAKLWKLLKWTIWMWAKTPTDHCWMRKSSPTEKALLRWGNGIKQKSMIGIGIGRYKQSGLGDRE